MNLRSLATRVLITFLVLIAYLQADMMFWTGGWGYEGFLQSLKPPQTWLYSNWVDIRIADYGAIQISVYNSWCIFGLAVILSLVLMWLNYFINEYKHLRSCKNADA